MKKKSFLNSLPVGIISILLAGLCGGLCYNANYKSQVLNDYLDNPFFGGFNRQAQADYDFYAKSYLMACIVLAVFGVYVVVQYSNWKKSQLL